MEAQSPYGSPVMWRESPSGPWRFGWLASVREACGRKVFVVSDRPDGSGARYAQGCVPFSEFCEMLKAGAVG